MNEIKFFTLLDSLLKSTETVNITVKKNADLDHTELVVSLLYVSQVQDKASKVIKPLLLKGTPEELNEGFFKHITDPLSSSAGLCRNIAEHEKSIEKAKEESVIAKAEKEKTKKIRDKSIKELEKAQKYFDSKDYDKCKFVCNEILKEDPKFSKADQLVKECDKSNTQSDMFSQAPTEAPKEPIVEEVQPLPDMPRAEPIIPPKLYTEQSIKPEQENNSIDQASKWDRREDDDAIDDIDEQDQAIIDEYDLKYNNSNQGQQNIY